MAYKHVILVRYGEIALKSEPVRRDFEHLLMRNIRKSLGSGGLVKRIYGRILVEKAFSFRKRKPLGKENYNSIIRTLEKTFGIVSFSICFVANSKKENIKKISLYVFRGAKPRKTDTFRVETNRVGSHPYNSQQINEKVGEAIVKKFGLRVNLKKPDKILYIDIRDKNAYIFTEKIPGPGGFPIGVQGKIISVVENENGLLSTWMMMKRGVVAVPVFVKMGKFKAKKYAKALEKWNSGHRMKYYTLKGADCKKINMIVKDERALGIALSEMKKDDKRHFNLPVFYPIIGFNNTQLKTCHKLGRFNIATLI